jgi:hypothetical protein
LLRFGCSNRGIRFTRRTLDERTTFRKGCDNKREKVGLKLGNLWNRGHVISVGVPRALRILWSLLAILVAVLSLDAETRASHKTQPRNQGRQIVDIVGRIIPILVALGRKRKNWSQMIILVRIGDSINSQAGDEGQ